MKNIETRKEIPMAKNVGVEGEVDDDGEGALASEWSEEGRGEGEGEIEVSDLKPMVKLQVPCDGSFVVTVALPSKLQLSSFCWLFWK